MNKKFISILLIIGLLTISLSPLAANLTVNDVQTESGKVSSEVSDENSEETQNVVVTADNGQENETTSENDTTSNDTDSNNVTITSEERKESSQAVSSGLDDLSNIESLILYNNLVKENTNGQFDKILGMLENFYQYKEEDFIAAFDELSDEDFDTLRHVYEFCHEEYQSDSTMSRYNKTIDIIDDIIDLDVEIGEDFVDLLKAFNRGEFDKLVDILENQEKYTPYDFMNELNSLSDDDLEKFYNFIQLLDANDVDDDKEDSDIITVITNKISSNFRSSSNDGNYQANDALSKVSKYHTKKIFKKEKSSDISSKISLIKELVYKYLNHEISFDELVILLDEADIDTSGLKLNDDGSLSWYGVDSVVFDDDSVTEDVVEKDDTENSDDYAGDSTAEESANNKKTENSDESVNQIDVTV